MKNQSKPNVFLCAGLTGGPIIPLVAVSKKLDATAIIVGIKKGVEKKIATENALLFLSLPKAKLGFFSFSNKNLWTIFLGIFDTILNIAKLVVAIILSLLYLVKYKPRLILSVGGFSAVPVFLAAKLTNLFGITKAKLAVHQQDPIMGLTNKICSRFADVLTCNFEYTRENFFSFNTATVLPSPIDPARFVDRDIFNVELRSFLKNSKIPIFLIFGGGSGSLFINNWVEKNLTTLCKNFKIVHLGGAIQKPGKTSLSNPNYFFTESINADMGMVLKRADFVLCRAGMSSICELLYLGKTAFLVPLPNSHQETNARIVADNFIILEQKNSKNWLQQITNSARMCKSTDRKLILEKQREMENTWREYYKNLNTLLKN
jgi:UDP-N-acetylglucosamine--N-acetylmuramyl-(pentapeptide) pyrophosphoryl-undecaprenol N-acetylglucosamine transferase